MLTTKVCITSLEDAKNFVNMTTKYANMDMHLRCGGFEIDAHSIVGVLTIANAEKSIILTADCPADNDALLADVRPFADGSAADASSAAPISA